MRYLLQLVLSVVTALKFKLLIRSEAYKLSAQRAIYAERRLPEIQRALNEADSNHIFLTGDSHAELLGKVCCYRSIVNGGIGGATARELAETTERLKFSKQIAVAVILIGQNDTWKWSNSLSKRNTNEFRLSLERIVLHLYKNADRIVFVAIPPFRSDMILYYNRRAIAKYNDIIKTLCIKQNHVFADIFKEVRSDQADILHHSVSMDATGLHLSDYSGVADRLKAVVRTLIGGESTAGQTLSRDTTKSRGPA